MGSRDNSSVDINHDNLDIADTIDVFLEITELFVGVDVWIFAIRSDVGPVPKFQTLNL